MKWDKISQVENFWRDLEWMPGAKKLWNFLAYAPSIMSAYVGRNQTLQRVRKNG